MLDIKWQNRSLKLTTAFFACLFASIIFFFSPNFVSAAPNINFLNYPSSVMIGEEFLVSFVIDSLTVSSSYYLKSRVGPDLSSLTKGQTKSDSGSWLSDSGDLWTSFPVYDADNEGRTAGQIISRVSPEVGVTGKNYYRLRILKVGDDTNKAETLEGYFEFTVNPVPTPTPTPTSEPVVPSAMPTPTATNTPASNSYDNISISEFMANPGSGDEWVELHNSNNYEVNLGDWYIDDLADNSNSPRSISGNISSGGYRQFFIGSNFLNNSGGDDVRLLDGNKNEKDKKSFNDSTLGKSWSKDSSGNWCQTDPTPNAVNPGCSSSTAAPAPTSTPTTKLSPTPTKTPTPKLSGSPTPTGGVLGEESASESGGFKLTGGLTEGENEENVQLPGQEKKKSLFPLKIQWSIALPFMAVIVGVGFVSFSVVSFLKSRKQQKIIV